MDSPMNSVLPTGYTHIRGGARTQEYVQPSHQKVAAGEVQGLILNRTIYEYVPSGPMFTGRVTYAPAILTGPFELGKKVPEIRFEGYTLYGVLPMEHLEDGTWHCHIDHK